jgi:hypothetical protein
MLVADAAGAELQTFLLPVHHHDCRMDIRFPHPVGMTIGVADGITESRGFPTNIALQNRYSLTNCWIYSILYNSILYINILGQTAQD